MREIKFRVYFTGSIMGKVKIAGYERIKEDNWEWMDLELNPDKGERWCRGVYPFGHRYNRVQYTGLKDKNENEIYEGDIIMGGNGYKSQVEFKNGCFMWCDQPLCYEEDVDESQAFSSSPDKWAIKVGNIYENPELLK